MDVVTDQIISISIDTRETVVVNFNDGPKRTSYTNSKENREEENHGVPQGSVFTFLSPVNFSGVFHNSLRAS